MDLRFLNGSQLAGYFKQWLAEYPDPYLQRYRKSIPFGHVKKHGVLLMTIVDGEVTFPPTVKTSDK